MAVKKEYNLDAFDEFARQLQKDHVAKRGNSVRNISPPKKIVPTNSTITSRTSNSPKGVSTSKTYTGSKVISLDQLARQLQEERNGTPRKNPVTPTPQKKKETIVPPVKKKVEPKTKDKKTTKTTKNKKSKNKNLHRAEADKVKYIRWTSPKKRGLISRIRLQSKLRGGYFDGLEDDFASGAVIKADVEESQKSKSWFDRSLYREVQAYEDAREDMNFGKKWQRFKVSLAVTLVALELGVLGVVGHSVHKSFEDARTAYGVVEYVNLKQEDKIMLETAASEFASQVKETDGYEFDYLSNLEFEEAYYSISQTESRIPSNSFKGALYRGEEMNFLDRIVQDAYGEERYNSFSDGQKRDLRQLAFELIPVAVNNKNNDPMWLRNPIVIDHLEARNAAREKGFEMKLLVNNDEKETVKNLGRLIHIVRTTPEYEYAAAKSTNTAQNFLAEMVEEAVGEEYGEISEKDKRDYLQFAYEILPENIKNNCIEDPIVVEAQSQTNDMEIGD